MSNEMIPTNLRVRIVGKKSRQVLYTNQTYITGLCHVDEGTLNDDQYWYIIPNHEENRAGTFQIQNTVTHQNLFMKSSTAIWAGNEGEVGTSHPDIFKDDQAIRLTRGKDENAGLYRFECPLGERTFMLYCRSTWQPPTLGCVDLTKEYNDQWFSFEYEPLEFISVKYEIRDEKSLNAKILNKRSVTLSSQEQKNDTDIQQEQTFKISETTEHQSTWEHALGLELAEKEGIEVGIPEVVNENVELSETMTAGFTTGKTVSTTKTWEMTVSLKCGAGKKTQCTVLLTKADIEVPCETTYKSKKTGELIKIKSLYKGTGCSNLKTAFF